MDGKKLVLSLLLIAAGADAALYGMKRGREEDAEDASQLSEPVARRGFLQRVQGGMVGLWQRLVGVSAESSVERTDGSVEERVERIQGMLEAGHGLRPAEMRECCKYSMHLMTAFTRSVQKTVAHRGAVDHREIDKAVRAAVNIAKVLEKKLKEDGSETWGVAEWVLQQLEQLTSIIADASEEFRQELGGSAFRNYLERIKGLFKPVSVPVEHVNAASSSASSSSSSVRQEAPRPSLQAAPVVARVPVAVPSVAVSSSSSSNLSLLDAKAVIAALRARNFNADALAASLANNPTLLVAAITPELTKAGRNGASKPLGVLLANAMKTLQRINELSPGRGAELRGCYSAILQAINECRDALRAAAEHGSNDAVEFLFNRHLADASFDRVSQELEASLATAERAAQR